MSLRKKILILENDEFLREILGNLLHKQGGYILSAPTIQQGIKESSEKTIDTVILGTSCPDFKGKQSLNYITKQLNQQKLLDFFILNTTENELTFIEPNKQMNIEQLSIQKILDLVI